MEDGESDDGNRVGIRGLPVPCASLPDEANESKGLSDVPSTALVDPSRAAITEINTKRARGRPPGHVHGLHADDGNKRSAHRNKMQESRLVATSQVHKRPCSFCALI